MKTDRWARIGALALVFGLSAICSAATEKDPAAPPMEQANEYEPKIDAWPLLFYSKDKKNHSILEIFGRFIERRESERRSEFFLRPFYREQIDKEKKERKTQVLWPLGWSYEHPGFKSERFWPIYFHEWKRTKPGGAKKRTTTWSTTLFPIYFDRLSAKGDEDFGLFPFYGRFHKRFGVDYGLFILWPLYVEMDKGESKTVNFPWPFLGITSGGGRSAFKFWPLFGWSEGPNYKKSFIAWPFFSEMKLKTKDGRKQQSTMLWPFYGVDDGPKGKAESVFWPFFQHEKNTQENYERWTLPWPFIIQSKGARKENTFWPLWVSKETKHDKTFVIAWPFFWRYWTRGKFLERKTTRLVPFFWAEEEKRPSEKKPFRKSWQIWPFIQVDSNAQGARYRCFSIDPFHFDDGLEANYGVLLNAEDNRVTKKYTSFRFLWRFIRADKSDDESFFEILPLVAIHKKKGETQRFTLLRGLFEVKRNEDGRKQTKILYFLKFGGKTKSAPKKAKPKK